MGRKYRLWVLMLSAAGVLSCEPTCQPPVNNIPVVSSMGVEKLSHTSAVLQAKLSNVDPPSISECGFRYAESEAFEEGHKITEEVPLPGSGAVTLSKELTGLEAGTLYKYEVYLANGILPEIVTMASTFRTLASEEDILTVGEEEVSMDSAGGEFTVKVSHNVDYKIHSNVDWVKQSPTMRAAVTDELLFSVEANPTVNARTGKLTFLSQDGTLKQEVTVIQAGKSSLVLDRNKVNFAAAGGAESVSVTSNLDWTAKTTASWLTIVPSSGKASKTGVTVALTAEANEGEADRTAMVVFKAEGVEQSLTVTQTGTMSSSVLVETAFGMQLRLVLVEGGTFDMGAQSTDAEGKNYDSEAYGDESPVHQVTLSDYYIGEIEVTQGQWQAVMGSNPSEFKKGDNYPVEQVSWDDIQSFIQKLNEQTGKRYALPTEAQWEYAARGGNRASGTKYSGGNDVNGVAWYWSNIPSQTSGDPGYGTQPVGTKSPNELGLYDMSGNVWEWCADWYNSSYSADSQTNPQGPSSGSDRVRRGGSWYHVAGVCRVSYRGGDNPLAGGCSTNKGFRLALPPSFTSITLDKAELAFEATGGEQTVTITSNRDWTAKTTASWLTIVPATGKAAKTGVTVKLTAEANDSENKRTATVVFKAGSVQKTLAVTQAGVFRMEMVLVEGGTFWMGAQSTDADGRNYDSEAWDDREAPVHQVTLSDDYYIGKYEVTQGQWKAVMGTNPSYFMKGDDYPVEKVSWDDIQSFIQKLNEKTGKHYALPTEAQWEFAARGGNKSEGYKYSGGADWDELAWHRSNSGSTTHHVGTKAPNELGLYDMSGNVWEWCVDWDGDYSADSQTNPQGPSAGSSRVLRGGSWDYVAGYCRVSYRGSGSPDLRISNNGFRLALLP